MVDKVDNLQENLTFVGDIKTENQVAVKTEITSSVIQAVAEANRELSDRHNTAVDTNEDIGEDEAARRRHERSLVRRPSYRKILTDLGGGPHNMISEDKEALSEGESGGSSEDHHERHHDRSHHQQHHQPHHYPHSHHSLRGNLLTNGGGVTGGVESLHGVGVPGMSPPTNGIVQYTTSPDSAGTPFFVPSMSAIGSSSGLGSPHDDSSRKREIRLLKNREAARECRRKKKEYIKCLENRVAVLENQNKALIEELKSLKELYTGTSKLM